jgi:hypothetical protein
MTPQAGRPRVLLIAGLAAAAAAAVFSIPRFTDPAWYYSFADRRELLGIPNCLNVVSNAPWAAIGIIGLLFVRRNRPGGSFTEHWERAGAGVLFAAIGLTAVGSVWFHLAPGPRTLFWDRLPMTVIFMSVLALAIGERIGMRAGRRLFVPLVAVGISSVLYWRLADDVRLYVLVQYFPLLAIPLLVWLFPAPYTRTADLLAVAGWYVLAKVFELADAPIFAATGLVSGHTLKHLAGAAATLWLLRMFWLRRPHV